MENILKYQEIDGKVMQLQREISSKSNKEESNKMYDYVKNAQCQTLQYDKEAKEITEELSKLLSVQSKGVALIEKYSQQDLSKLNPDELKDLDIKINQAVSNLTELESRINVQTERARRVLQECDAIRKRAFMARQKYQDNKAIYENLMREKEPIIADLKKQMEELLPKIEPAMISKYRSLRQDGLYPVVVPLEGTRCGGCRMEMPSMTVEKLKQKGHIECDQCRRIIYLKDK